MTVTGKRGVPVTPATVGTERARSIAAKELGVWRRAGFRGYDAFFRAAAFTAEDCAHSVEQRADDDTVRDFADAWRLLADRRHRADRLHVANWRRRAAVTR